MTVLNSWQKISRVVSGKPFGNGSAGNATVSASPSHATASGSAGSTSLTIGTAVLSNGDVFAIHQTRGTGVGQWEINKVESGGGTTSITCSKSLQYNYGTGAQVIKIPLYDQVTLGSYTISGWNGSTGGIDFICGKTTIGGSGTVTAVGGNSSATGSTTDSAGGTGAGFKGGTGKYNAQAFQGDGSVGTGGQSTAANGNGGGGGASGNSNGGGGGGNANAGTSGNGEGTPGTGGNQVGSSDLTVIFLGGGGGGGQTSNTSSNERSGGGGGGGILVLISESIDISSATINTNGGNAADAFWDGGGGAGGSILLVGKDITLGTNKATATGGLGGGASIGAKRGGDGSVGRIAVHHSGTVTGTTNPTFFDQTDTSLVESGGGFFNFL